MSDDVDGLRTRRWEIAGFCVIAALMTWDLAVDYREGAGWFHILAELAILAIAATAALMLWRRYTRTRTDLSSARAEAARWRQENSQILRGLSEAMAGQFQRWGLSSAETEIGFLLLKGMSHKEIATLRNTSERTVREQSRSVYRKAGLAGRAELSAFFLEDLMLPATPPLDENTQ